MSSYAEVLLPLPLGGNFTYSVPEAMREELTVGSRVIVPFGKRKFYTGIVVGFVPVAPRAYEVKEITMVLDLHPIVRHPQLRFWEWMAEYYLCSMGEVYKAAVPSGLKIESETNFEANPDFDTEDMSMLSEREVIAYQLLATKGKLAAKDIEKETGFRNIPLLMQRMVTKGAAIVSESLVEKYRAKKEKYVKIAIERGSDEALRQAFEAVKGAKKQETLFMTLLHLSAFTVKSKQLVEVTQEQLLEKSACTTNILKALADKGLVERYTKEISRFGEANVLIDSIPELTEAQSEAFKSLCKALAERPVALLHGVTSSGKTEIYAHLIQSMLDQNTQVLYLVPEIALTTQLTSRLRSYFGSKLVVYHSKFGDNERVEIWNRLLRSNEPCVVVGARSALFLPFAKLGLVVVDEEHDASYKQYDPAPRYNARDSAIMLAHMHGAKTVLGSATPAIDTYYKAKSGKYGLVTLSERYQGLELPEVEVVDIAKEYKKKAVTGSMANITISAVRNAVADGKQAILFLNRRGFAPIARCTQCEYIPKCQYCDVSLTYHKRANVLMCHYCGTVYPLPELCPACQKPTIEVVGYGTERIEDEVEEIFPEAKVIRMDNDTTRNKNSYETLINQFSDHKADILVGTQMVTKGLDFDDVSIVSILNADSVINFPDFRSSERAFDMLAQVSGRAGRKGQTGRVLLQTRNPGHPVIGYIQRHDYQGFYEQELVERRAYSYPPFARLIYIHLKHRDERELDNIAAAYAQRMRELFGTRVQGPARPAVARVQMMYIRQIMLKVELNASLSKIKEILRDLHGELHAKIPAMRSLVLYYDVDPM